MEFIVLIFMIVIVVAILWHTLVASFMRAVIGIVATCYAACGTPSELSRLGNSRYRQSDQ